MSETLAEAKCIAEEILNTRCPICHGPIDVYEDSYRGMYIACKMCGHIFGKYMDIWGGAPFEKAFFEMAKLEIDCLKGIGEKFDAIQEKEWVLSEEIRLKWIEGEPVDGADLRSEHCKDG